MEKIREDYYSKKWISKEELVKLLEYEKIELIVKYQEKDEELRLLLNNFNQTALNNYQLLERKFQGLTKSLK